MAGLTLDSCNACPLAESRACIVNPFGHLDCPSILFVGTSPRAEDEEAGQPFMGKDGHILAGLVHLAEVPLKEVAMTNATLCRGPGGRPPKAAEVTACHDNLADHINRIQPDVIVSLGAPALSSLYKAVPLKDMVGQTLTIDIEGCEYPLVPTYHPAYLRQGKKGNWERTEMMVAHLQKAHRLAGQVQRDEPITRAETKWFAARTVDDVKTMVEHLHADTAKRGTPLAVDTETTGLDWQTDELLCLQLSSAPGFGFVIPFLHNNVEVTYKNARITKQRQEELADRRNPKREAEEVWLAAYDKAWADSLAGVNSTEVSSEMVVPSGKVQVVDKRVSQLEPYWNMEDLPKVLDLVGALLASDIPKAMQNGPFDVPILERKPSEAITAATSFGFTVNAIEEDTMLAAKVVSENTPSNLTLLTAQYTDIPYYEEEIKAQTKNKKKMAEADDGVTWKYGAIDVDVVQQVLPILKTKMDAQENTRWLYDHIQVPMVRLVSDLKKVGALIDVPFFRRLCEHFAHEHKEIEQEAFKIYGGPFNYSDVALKNLLFDELDLPLTNRKTDSAIGCNKCGSKRDEPCREHAATGKAELKDLHDRTNHPILPPIIELKSLAKWQSTYLSGTGDTDSGYARFIQVDNRIYSDWGLRTETGRLNCTSPNLMNIPKGVVVDCDACDIHSKNALREIVIAPPGSVVMTADWNQLEVWGLAYRTGDETLLSLLLGGRDVHTYVARQLGAMGIAPDIFPNIDTEFDDTEWKMAHDDLRSKAKPFVFGLSYGLTAEGASIRLNCSVDDAQLLIDGFLIIFPGLPEYFKEVNSMVLNPPYAVPNWAGRWRHWPQMPLLQKLGYRREIESACREGINFIIQAGGHDLHVAAWIRTVANTALMKRLVPVIEAHDSLTAEALAADQDQVINTAWRVKDLWEKTAKGLVTPQGKPLGWEVPVAIEWGANMGHPEWELTVKGEVKEKHYE